MMTSREILVRLAIAGLLLVAIGAAGNIGTNQGLFPQQKPPHFQQLPQFRFDLLNHQWVRICGPYPSEICA